MDHLDNLAPQVATASLENPACPVCRDPKVTRDHKAVQDCLVPRAKQRSMANLDKKEMPESQDLLEPLVCQALKVHPANQDSWDPKATLDCPVLLEHPGVQASPVWSV